MESPLALTPASSFPAAEKSVVPVSDSVPLPRSAAAYRGINLRLYDYFVLQFTSPYAWGCTADELRAMYRENISADHVEVGVGSGYFLAAEQRSTTWTDLNLIDPNPSALEYVAKRLSSSTPTSHVANILVRTSLPNRRFRSVAANYVLHCLPDDRDSKREAIANLAHLTDDTGTLFGATVLGEAQHNYLGRALMRGCNALGVFGNRHDTEQTLRQDLQQYFRNVEVERRNRVAMFRASEPVR